MKTFLATIALSVTMVGCGTKTIIVEATAPSTVAPPTTISIISADEAFINGVAADFPQEVARLGKAYLIELGRTTCQAIDEGMTFADMSNMVTSSGANAGLIGSVTREAIHNYCPENQWFIDTLSTN